MKDVLGMVENSRYVIYIKDLTEGIEVVESFNMAKITPLSLTAHHEDPAITSEDERNSGNQYGFATLCIRSFVSFP
jgi:hypothetical protein